MKNSYINAMRIAAQSAGKGDFHTACRLAGEVASIAFSEGDINACREAALIAAKLSDIYIQQLIFKYSGRGDHDCR